MLKIAAAIFGAIGGYFGAYFIISMLYNWDQNEPAYVQNSILILSATITAGLSIKYYDSIVIFSTAVLGSFFFVHGFSLIFESKEDSVYNQISSDNDFKSVMWAYLSVFLIMISGGTYYQLKQRYLEVKFDTY